MKPVFLIYVVLENSYVNVQKHQHIVYEVCDMHVHVSHYTKKSKINNNKSTTEIKEVNKKRITHNHMSPEKTLWIETQNRKQNFLERKPLKYVINGSISLFSVTTRIIKSEKKVSERDTNKFGIIWQHNSLVT